MNTFITAAALLVLAVLVFVWYTARGTRGAIKGAQAQEAPTAPGVETLRYHVPDAQDPTVLIAALDVAGYNADLDDVSGDKHLVIACPAGSDRERARVRNVLAENNSASTEGPDIDRGKIVFEDER